MRTAESEIDHDRFSSEINIPLYNFHMAENVEMFLKKAPWHGFYEHRNAIRDAIAGDELDYIFNTIKRDTETPIIYESGCASGITTMELVKEIENHNINNYRLIAHDVNPLLIENARSRFRRNKKVKFEVRSGCNYEDIDTQSVDAIFSFNAMVPFLFSCYEEGDKDVYKRYLSNVSRVLKDEKPLVLTYLFDIMTLIKDDGSEYGMKKWLGHVHSITFEPFFEILGE